MKIVFLASLAVMLVVALATLAADKAPQVYLVFFPFDGAAISPVGAKVLDTVISDFQRSKASSIGVGGYTDLAGPTAHNLKLSEQRANAVKDYLIAHGVKPGALRVEWFGTRNPRVATAKGVRNDQNRRSEIVLRQ